MAGNRIAALFAALTLASPALASPALASPAPVQPVELRGRIDSHMADRVRASLDAGARDFTINTSTGGYVVVAAIIAGLLRAHQASITVNGLCASACALLVIGVQDKRYTSEADVEIHGARYRNPQTGKDDEAPARSAADYMVANGVPEAIAYGPGMGFNMHRLSTADLNRMGFVAGP